MARSDRNPHIDITASDRTRQAFDGVQDNIRKTSGLQRSWNAGLNANRRAVQQFGFQMSDFAIQIAGGQSAMLAFTQQGGQMLQFFGPAGAILAAFLAVFGSIAIAMQKSGVAMTQLTPILGVLQDEFKMLWEILGNLGSAFIDFANLVVNNLDRVLITATVVALFFIGKWVVAFAAARIAIFSLVGALTALRAIMIRSFIFAFLVGLGELMYQFGLLVEYVGSVGGAFKLLADAGVEAWDRIKMAGLVFWNLIAANIAENRADWKRYWVSVGIGIREFANDAVGIYKGIFAAIKVIFSNLPTVMRRIGALAVNALIDEIQKRIGTLVQLINPLLTLGGKFPDMAIGMPDLSGLKVKVPGDAVAADIKSAFDNAANQNYIPPVALDHAISLGEASQLDEIASNYRSMADILVESLKRPMVAWKALREAMKAAQDDGSKIDIRDWFGGGGDKDKGKGSGKDAVDALKARIKEIKDLYEGMQNTVKSAFSSTFKSLFDETQSFTDSVKKALGSILDKVADMILDPVWDLFARKITNVLIGAPSKSGTSLVGGLFSGFASAVFPSYDGGGRTPDGSRSGGVDGKGGMMAILHPNEDVIPRGSSSFGAAAMQQMMGQLLISLDPGLRAELVGDMQNVAVETYSAREGSTINRAVAQSGAASRATKDFYGG